MYSKVEEALYFMIKANRGLIAKQDSINRLFNDMFVYNNMKEITSTEDILVASILHNIINYTDYGYEEIEETFGTLVADIVLDLSEDMSIAKWFDRKKDFIKRMRKNTNVDIINIMLVDKLQILLSYYDNYNKIGDKIWKSTSGNKDENCFLYREIYNIGRCKNANKKILERYKKLILLYFDSVDES